MESSNDFFWKIQISLINFKNICFFVVGVIFIIFAYNYIMWRLEKRKKTKKA